MELFATQCVWEGDRLTVHEPSQNMYNVTFGLRRAARDRSRADPRDLDLCRRRVRLEGLHHPAHRARRAGRPAAWPARQAGADARAGVHPLHLSRREPATCAARRRPRRSPHRHATRGVGADIPRRQRSDGRGVDDSAALRVPKHRGAREHRRCGSLDPGLPASAWRDALRLRAADRPRRARHRARHGPDRAAPRERHPDRAGGRPPLHQPLADAMFRRGGGGVRLERAAQ